MSSVIILKISNYANLIRFNKPVGSILLLWPTLWGLWLANHGIPDLRLLSIFIVGVFLIRSAGCIINDLADRDFDGDVDRTKNRPLVNQNEANRLSVKQAFGFLFLLLVLALGLVLEIINITNSYKIVVHSVIALTLTALYPFCKRFIYCPQFILGLAFGYAIPMAYVASNQGFTLVTLLMYFASIIHSIIYDTFYAMADIKDDLQIGVKSSAIWLQNTFGRYDSIVIFGLQLLFLADIVLISYLLEFNYYLIMLCILLLLFLYQLKLIEGREPEKCIQAFKNNNWIGLLIFLGLFIEFI